MAGDALTPVSTLCLAILLHGERTGYEIKKASVDGDYRYFGDASYGSIYPALARLADEGFVTQREEIHTGRPARKVYAITAAGRSALVTELSQAPGPDLFRSRFLLVAKLAPMLPAAVVASAVAERRNGLATEIAHLQRIAEEDSDNPTVAWVAGYGLACMAASLDHLERNGDALIAMSEAPLADAAE